MNQQRMQLSGMRMASPRQTFPKSMIQQHHHHQQQQQQQFQSPQHQFTKPVVDVMKDTEKLQNDQQRLTSLHTKLHKEAEKIRHWKSEKEMELRQKEKSLSEATGTIESLRKSIIELQFKNEEFSTKLQDEEIEKAQTAQKLHTVREMANVLRDQMVQLEGRVKKGENDKDDAVNTNQNMLNDHQNLVLKFQELDISQSTMVEKNSNQVQKLKDTHETQKSELQSNIRHLENQVIALMQTKTTQEEVINDYKKKYSDNEELIKRFTRELDENRKKLKSAEEVIRSQEQNLSDLQTKHEELISTFTSTQESLQDYQQKTKYFEEMLEKHRIMAEETQAMCTKEINSLQNDIQQLKTTIEEKHGEMECLKIEKREQQDSITSLQQQISIDKNKEQQLTSQVDEANSNIKSCMQKEEQLNLQINQLALELQKSQEQMSNLSSINGEMADKINQSSNNLTSMLDEKSSLLKLFEDAKNQITQYQTKEASANVDIEKLNAHITEMENDLNERDNKLTEILNQNTLFENNLKNAEEEIAQHQLQIQSLQNEKCVQQSVIDERTTELQSVNQELTSLQQTLATQTEEIELLSVQGQENTEQMKSVLADREKTAEDLGHKTKSLKTEITEKSKHIKNIEKENKSLKTQLKNKTEKNTGLQEEIEQTKNELSQMQSRMTDTEKLLNDCQASLKSQQENFDVDQKEFCTTLEQYKRENDKIVEDHIQDNDNIKRQMEEMKIKFTEELELRRNDVQEKDNMLELQSKRVEQLQLGLTDKDTQEMKIGELEQLLQESKSNILANQVKTSELQKELEDTFERLQQETREKEKLQQIMSSNRRNQDRLVPTTPKAHTPKTPNTIGRSTREKRVLFAGPVADDTSDTSMEVENNYQQIMNQNLKTPTLPPQKRLKNIRYSPKDSPFQEKKTPKTPTLRVGKKINDKTGNEVSSLMSAHHKAVKSVEKTIYDEKPSASPSIFKAKKSSPCIRQSNLKTHKMKKISMKKSQRLEEDFTWFESDKNFAFTE